MAAIARMGPRPVLEYQSLQSFLSRNGREPVAPLVARLATYCSAPSVRRQDQPTGICV